MNGVGIWIFQEIFASFADQGVSSSLIGSVILMIYEGGMVEKGTELDRIYALER